MKRKRIYVSFFFFTYRLKDVRVLKTNAILQLNISWRSQTQWNEHGSNNSLCSQHTEPKPINVHSELFNHIVCALYVLLQTIEKEIPSYSTPMLNSLCVYVSHVSLFFLHFFISYSSSSFVRFELQLDSRQPISILHWPTVYIIYTCPSSVSFLFIVHL